MTEQNTPLLTSDAETRHLIQKLLLQVVASKTETATKLKELNLGDNFLQSVLETIELTLVTMHSKKQTKSRRDNLHKAIDEHILAEDEASVDNPNNLSQERSSRFKWFLELGI